MSTNHDEIRDVEKFINNQLEVDKFFISLEKNRVSRTDFQIDKTLKEYNLPINLFKILKENIGDTEDLSKLRKEFLTPSLHEILLKQEFLKRYEELILSRFTKPKPKVRRTTKSKKKKRFSWSSKWNKMNRSDHKKLMDLIIEKLHECEGSYMRCEELYPRKIPTTNYKDLLFDYYPEFHKKYNETKIEIRDKNVDTWENGIIERFEYFSNQGLLPNHTTGISGLVTYNYRKSFFEKYRSLKSKFEDYKKSIDWSEISGRNSPHVRLQQVEDYLQKLYDLKKNYKIKKEWIGKFDNKSLTIKSDQFTLPNYKRIFHREIDKVISNYENQRLEQKKRILPWERNNNLKLQREKKKKENIRRINSLRKGFKYYEVQQVLNDYPNLYGDYEKYLMKFRYTDINKPFQLMKITPSIGGKLLRGIYPSNQEIKDKFKSIQLKVKENQIKIKKEKFLELLEKNKGDLNKTIKDSNDFPGSHFNVLKEDVKWRKKYTSLQTKIQKEIEKKYIDESIERYRSLIKRGIHPTESLVLGGFGGSDRGGRSVFMNHVFGNNKDFLKEYTNDLERWKTNVIPNIKINDSKTIEWKRDYLDKLLNLKKDVLDQYKGFLKTNPLTDQIQPKEYRSPFVKTHPYYQFIGITYPWYFIKKWDTNYFDTERSYSKQILKYEVDKRSFTERVPKEWINRVKRISSRGKSYFDINNKEIFRKCYCCSMVKDIVEFNVTGYNCKSCDDVMRYKKKTIVRGSITEKYYKNKLIRRIDQNGKVVERRCNSCDNLMRKESFTHLYKGSSICNNCYSVLPNNKLTRRGEFYNGKQIRWYDPVTFQVIKKQCRSCKKVRNREDYTIDRRSTSIDGIGVECISCRRSKKQKVK